MKMGSCTYPATDQCMIMSPKQQNILKKLRLGIRIGVTFVRLLWIGEFPALDGGPLHIFSI